jgi:hypothetical protein
MMSRREPGMAARQTFWLLPGTLRNQRIAGGLCRPQLNISADVSYDCWCNRTTKKRIHGRIINSVSSLVVDHLVNNAGVANVCWFEDVPDVAALKRVLVGLKVLDEGSRCLN